MDDKIKMTSPPENVRDCGPSAAPFYVANWICVYDKMPRPYDDLVFLDSTAERIDGQKHLGHFDGKDWLSGNDEIVVSFVSHWIALPSSAAAIDDMLDAVYVYAHAHGLLERI